MSEPESEPEERTPEQIAWSEAAAQLLLATPDELARRLAQALSRGRR